MTFSFQTPSAHQQLQPTLTYLVGEPGSGKSTLVAHLTSRWPHRDHDKPFAHRVLGCGVTELGKRRPDFPGTDALSMSVQPLVLRWMEETRPFRLLGEGDRLGTQSFLEQAEQIGYTVNVFALWGPEEAALQRRIRGTAQDEEWVNGRRSKVRNIMDARTCTVLPAGASMATLTERMLATGDPTIQALRGAR